MRSPRAYLLAVPDLTSLLCEARAHAAAARYRDALALLGRAIQREPRSAIVWHEIGLVLARQGEREEALEAFDHALDLDPLHAASYFQQGLLHAELGRSAQALFCFSRSAELDPHFRAAVKAACP